MKSKLEPPEIIRLSSRSFNELRMMLHMLGYDAHVANGVICMGDFRIEAADRPPRLDDLGSGVHGDE